MYKNVDYHRQRESMKKTYGCDTMCTAKFLSSTIYLQSGQTHSCYHPLPHDIPLEEIKVNPSALHNTNHKKLARKEMLDGIRPKECSYCWNIEDIDSNLLSDRVIKSTNELLMTPDAHEEILKNGHEFNYSPTYLEVSFGNECNMKCAYCHPKASSAWMKEMDLHGQFPKAPQLQKSWKTIYSEEDNPYVEAFWKWWPTLKENIKVLRITGGEPLLQKSTYKFLDLLIDEPCPKLVLQINSNFNIKNLLMTRFCNKIKQLIDENKIGQVHIYTSLESWGERACYARSGLDLDLFEKNLDTVMNTLGDLPTSKFSGITIMNTFNIMSVTSYEKFLSKVLGWRHKYNEITTEKGKLRFDIPHCTEPSHWTLIGLPDNYDSYFESITTYINKYSWKNNYKNIKQNQSEFYFNYFSDEEVESWNRVVKYWQKIKEDREKVYPPSHVTVEKIDDARRNWFLFIEETDKRRGTSFLNIFPEMKDYYNLCSKLENVKYKVHNQNFREKCLTDKNLEINLDDVFFEYHEKLGENLLKYRYKQQYSTKLA